MTRLTPVYKHEGTWSSTTVCEANARNLECFVLVAPLGVTLPENIQDFQVLLLDGEDDAEIPGYTLKRYEDVIYGVTLRNCMWVRTNLSFQFDPETHQLIEFSYSLPELPAIWNILDIEDYAPCTYPSLMQAYEAITGLPEDLRTKFFEFANNYASEIFFMLQKKYYALPVHIDTFWRPNVYVPEFKNTLQECVDLINAIDQSVAIELYNSWNKYSNEFWAVFPRIMKAGTGKRTNLFA